jgi:hypothetical protein
MENQILSQQPQQPYQEQSYQEQPHQQQPYQQQPYQDESYQQQPFPQPSTKQNEPVPGTPAMPGMPEQPVKKRSALAGFFTFIILLLLFVITIGVFILMSAFVSFNSQLHYYVAVSIVSLSAGTLISLIANELIRTDKGFLWSCSLISFLTAGLVSTAINIQIYLAQKLSELSTQAGEANIGGAGLLSMFAPPSNPLTTSLLIIIFFNIPTLIIFFKKKQKKAWHLVIYLPPIIVFLIMFYLLPMFILSQLPVISGILP